MSRPNITIVQQTGSTNTDLAAALRSLSLPAEGDWLVARRQSAGKGRQGREWFDGAGNFMGSSVVQLRSNDPAPQTLGLVVALAVYDAVQALLPEPSKPRLKWPNDVLLGEGKLSGILLEMLADCVIVGIGVNLKQAPDLPDRKTAAIADIAPPPRLEDFASTLAAAFAARLEEWRSSGLQTVLAQFEQRSIHTIGSAVTVHDTDDSHISGTFAGFEPGDGALRLRLADGSERVIRAGDII